MKKFFLLILLLLFSCQNEYLEFHQDKEKQTQMKNQINDFSFDDIAYLSWLTLNKTPDLNFL